MLEQTIYKVNSFSTTPAKIAEALEKHPPEEVQAISVPLENMASLIYASYDTAVAVLKILGEEHGTILTLEPENKHIDVIVSEDADSEDGV